MRASTGTDYERRLLAAAEYVLEQDRRAGDAPPPLDPEGIGVSATLKPHQIEGVAWLLRRYELGVNVLLGDEMGLGKTLQAISLLSYLKRHYMINGPFLVLCPLSVTEGWMSEYSKFCPGLVVVQYVGDKGHRRDLRRTMHEQSQQHFPTNDGQSKLHFDVLLTTYDIALLDQDFLSQIPWHYAIIDEAQRLKNPSSVLYNVLEEKFVMPRRLLMTGTPIQNNLSELWALMHFCLSSVFGTLENFISTFKEAGTSKTGHNTREASGQFQLLKYILGAFMLRRTKAFLAKSGALMLPPLTEITVIVPLVPLQRKVCMSILRRELPTLLALSSGASNYQSLQNIVMQLRKACSHPYLFSGIEPEPYEEGEHLVQASGKLIVLDQLLHKLRVNGHRVLLFAQMTHTLDILQDFLELRKYTYERLDGSVRAEERFAAIRNFSKQPTAPQNSLGAPFVFMISTRAGGVGLNLVSADTVIFYEQDWNPQVDKQALQRAHRIGQMHHVLSINLVTGHSIEEVIMRRAARKLCLSNNVVGQDEVIHELGTDTKAESGDMRSLIFGLQVFDPLELDNGSLSEKSVTDLIAMTDRVVEMRNHGFSDKDDQRFEFCPTAVLDDGFCMKRSGSDGSDLELDEASYLSWVEKFKEASETFQHANVDPGRRNISEETRLKREADKKRAEEKKISKWEGLGYKSLAVKEPDTVYDDVTLSDKGSIKFMYGDCTKPQRQYPSEPAIIFSCVDTSGNWGHGGMFDALANLSMSIPDAYVRASQCSDLHMGDLHLIKLSDSSGDENISGPSNWVALAVVQSYNSRRKVPRSNISISDLEMCLSKVSFSAAQLSATIHLPRIGYQGGSDRSEWYVVERLLKKHSSIHGVDFLVYYFRHTSRG